MGLFLLAFGEGIFCRFCCAKYRGMLICDKLVQWYWDTEIEYGGKFYDITRVDVFESYKQDLKLFAKLEKKITPQDEELINI